MRMIGEARRDEKIELEKGAINEGRVSQADPAGRFY